MFTFAFLQEYSNPRSRMNKVNAELMDIHNVMKRNITDVLNRGEKLEDAQRMSSQLYDESKGM